MQIDKSKFETTPFVKRINKPWGHEIILTPQNLKRTAKLLIIKKNHRLSLQYHDKIEETLCLIKGKTKLSIENKTDKLKNIIMKSNQGYTIRKGQQHRIEAITDSIVSETSSPQTGKTYRLEDDYHRKTVASRLDS